MTLLKHQAHFPALAAKCATYLLILLFGPRTFNQFRIQDLIPAVLTLVLGVTLREANPKQDTSERPSWITVDVNHGKKKKNP